VKAPGGYFDKYDFEQHPWTVDPGRILRNTATFVGGKLAGDGIPFRIEFLGTAILGGYVPPPPK
jgi:hypothetical protein